MSPTADLSGGEAELSRAFVHHFWNSDLAWCQEYLSDDFVFFDDGAEARAFDSMQLGRVIAERNPGRTTRAILIGERYETVCESERLCVVNGSYLRFSDLGGAPSAVRIASAFIWDRRCEPPRLRQYRISSTPCATGDVASCAGVGSGSNRDPDSAADARTGTGTGSGANAGRSPNARTARPLRSVDAVSVRDVDGTMHRFTRADVYSLEATGARTVIRTASSSITVRGCLTAVIDELRLNLVRVHRSFAVNPAHVTSLAHQTLMLDNGSQIKVPVKRLRHVKNDLFSRGERP